MFLSLIPTFYKNVDKVDIIRKTLGVNTARRTTLGPIGIVHLTMNIEEHSFKHSFIICTKLKQSLIIDRLYSKVQNRGRRRHLWNIIFKIRQTKNSYCNTERQVMTIYETKLTEKQETNEKSHVVTENTVTLLPYQSLLYH